MGRVDMRAFGIIAVCMLACLPPACERNTNDPTVAPANRHIVTFDSLGGSAINQQAVAPGERLVEPAAPSRAGHTFTGWFTDPACSKSWNFKANTITGDSTLYARWSVNRYTLRYAAGPNGSIGGPAMQAVSHGESGATVTAIPARGHHFVQWSDGSTANPRTDGAVTANVSVTAAFLIKQYPLTYAPGAGGSIAGTALQVVNHGASGSPVTAVPNAGHRFAQWSDGSTANPRTDAAVTGAISATAIFTAEKHRRGVAPPESPVK